MEVKFWGVRGSFPVPITPEEFRIKTRKLLKLSRGVDISTGEKIENFLNNLPRAISGIYGGNTSCVSVKTEKHLLIFDMGSGARILGYNILQMPEYRDGGVLDIFFSHTHWDHIQGLPFFAPLYMKNFKLIFYSPFQTIKERLVLQQKFDYFPIGLEQLASQKEFKNLKNLKSLEFDDGTKIVWHKLIHPGDSYSYKVSNSEKSVVYATDTEFYKIDEEFMDEVASVWDKADVLIFDAQYSPEEYIKKISWGHSSTLMAIDIALKCNVKRLVLFHHEPNYSDEFIDNSFKRAKEYLNTVAPESNLEIIPAFEGLKIEV